MNISEWSIVATCGLTAITAIACFILWIRVTAIEQKFNNLITIDELNKQVDKIIKKG